MKPPAFQFYPDNFVAGTAHMTIEEIGAYILLLCYQWNAGSIPDDDAMIRRIGRITQALPLGFIREKFTAFPDGLKNPRLERERAKQMEYRQKQAKNGAKGGRPKGLANPTVSFGLSQTKAKKSFPSPSPSPSLVSNTYIAAGVTQGNAPVTQGNAKALPDTHTQKTPETDPLSAEAIYSAYPLKVGRKVALRAILGALKAIPAAKLLERTEVYAATVATWPLSDRQFIPHPATWFNQGRYDDDPATWKRQHAKNEQPRSHGPDRNKGTYGEMRLARERELAGKVAGS